MYSGPGVKTSPDYPIPDTMKAWVLGNPGERKDDITGGQHHDRVKDKGIHGSN